MKALQLVEVGRPLAMREVPRPVPGPGEVLIRIAAAGVCHSDAHYRSGAGAVGPLPQTLGHEIAGVIEEVGPGVDPSRVGRPAAVHYLLSCGRCPSCTRGREQFCDTGSMLGKWCDGGFAEYIAVPARNAVPTPEGVDPAHAAVMMCSSSTSLHALNKAGLKAGETAAVFGAGGLGLSAVQLALAMGAAKVFAVDINPDKLALAQRLGAEPVDATKTDPVKALQEAGGGGVDVALEVIGLESTMNQAVRCLGPFGRAALAGIGGVPFSIDSYPDLLCKEAQVIGCSDHLLHELPVLLDFAAQGRLDLSSIISRRIPLDADAVNQALDDLDSFGAQTRTVVIP